MSSVCFVMQIYMACGQMQVSGPDQCGTAALLNLLIFCNHFRDTNQQKVTEAIKCCNELMLSSEVRVSSPWLEEFGKKTLDLPSEFQTVPEVGSASTAIRKGKTGGSVFFCPKIKEDWERVGRRSCSHLKQLLSSDWAVRVQAEAGQLDELEEEMERFLTCLQIKEMKQELPKEKLQEVYLLVEEQERLSEKLL
ncbi:uncharacterized protein CXorf38 homolog [Apteryx rowi]|uniref:uncharacterized protein CXorf38 homolog n=1 Tax=Apteryx rowi TaxID=308060 RepID=UPI000E1D61A1|nr:uncharacterized protein CXorf38 homolog [Apteryx rowi]